MMPETSPGEHHCGTHGSAWLRGQLLVEYFPFFVTA